MDARGQIENLLARYSRLFDDGELDGYAELFKHGTINGLSDHDSIVAFFREQTQSYEGKPHTRHVIANIEIDIDEEAGTASGRCLLTLYQALPDFPLQVILVGSYIDEYQRIDGGWHFRSRGFEPHLLGDMSRHARQSA